MSSFNPSLSARRPSTVQSGATAGWAWQDVVATTKMGRAAMTARQNIAHASTCQAPLDESARSRFAAHAGARAEPGMEGLQQVENVEHRKAERLLQCRLVGRQVGAFEHDRVDPGMARHQLAPGCHRLALDLIAIEG